MSAISLSLSRSNVSRVAFGVALVALSACKPTTASFVRKNRAEITTLLARAQDVSAHLAEIPAETVPFEGVVRADVALLPVEDFGWLAPVDGASRIDAKLFTTGRPAMDGTLYHLSSTLREEAGNRFPKARVEDLERMLGTLRAQRFLGVVTTTEWTGSGSDASSIGGAAWRGRVAMWSFAERRWIGVIPVHVVDKARSTITGASLVNRGTGTVRSMDSTPADVDYRFSCMLDFALAEAVKGGQPAELEIASDGKVQPASTPRAPTAWLPPSAGRVPPKRPTRR